MNLLDMALRNLLRRPARSALTVAAVALGVAATVALTAISWGFEASWQKANDARGTDLIVTRVASENSMPQPFAAAAPRAVLQALPHVHEAVGLLSEMLSVSEGAPPVFVFGWAQPSYLWDHLRLVQGRWPASDAASEAVLGPIAAELLHRGPGDRIEIEGRPFVVTGVFESPAVVENGAVIIPLGQAQQVTDKPGKVNVLNLRLDRPLAEPELAALKATVRSALPGFVAITSGELVRQNAIVRIAKAMSQATVLVACLVGALVVFNAMLMSVAERTREIGLLQALGWQRRTVVALVMAEAALLALAGGGAGIALGAAASAALEHLPLMRGKIDAVFSPGFFVLVLALSLAFGALGGLYPAWHAARLRPARALRQET